MTSAEHAALLRQQDIDRAGEEWQVTAEELESMGGDYEMEESTMSPVTIDLTEYPDPFADDLPAPQVVTLIWLDDTCRCGAALETDYARMYEECQACNERMWAKYGG